jgi:hypothetical protein
MAKLSATTVFPTILIVFCLWNASLAFKNSLHWPVMMPDDWAQLDRSLDRTRTILASLPDRHVEYRVEEASETYDISEYYRLQYLLTPTILQRLSGTGRFVLVEFWNTKKAKPLPDLVLVEDFGNGFALYRRP